tara:strand:+ start:1108 stop:1314 length:207 start_codon:yes stop_codon:yes gene_type:complete
MSRFRANDVVVCLEQGSIKDTNLLYGQIGVVEESLKGIVNVKCSDNMFDDWVIDTLFEEHEIVKIGVL